MISSPNFIEKPLRDGRHDAKHLQKIYLSLQVGGDAVVK